MRRLKEKLCTLRSNINKIVLTLCLLTIACSSIHSQDTSKITITSDQLRTANLIFAEHKEYSKLVPLLKLENSNLQSINQTWIRTDSIKTSQLNYKNQIISEQCYKIDKMQNTIKIGTTVTGVSIITAILCLILK